MYTVGLYTLGCKVSQYETEAVAEGFLSEGFAVRDFNEFCDAYVINTCTVTAESDRKSRQFIRRALKKNPEAVVAVMGCYSQRSPEEVMKIEGVSVLVGTDKKLSVIPRVKALLEERNAGIYGKSLEVSELSSASFEKMKINSAPRTRAYIKIEDGCESKCSYCAIRLARGRVRSKLPAEVIEEVEALCRNGSREIVLTGIETGAYGKDFSFEYGLGDLIMELDGRRSCERIRLGSLAPELVGKAFVEKVGNTKILAPHFHISMQSGSDAVLRRMKRRYNSQTALENIERLRDVFPGAEFTTDMMVGFPGESEEDFRLSLEFIRRAQFLDVHVFAYSKRHGTEASEYDGQIPESVKRERSRIMIEEKNKVRDMRLERIVRQVESLPVIAETALGGGEYSAHADNFAEIRFMASGEKDLRGELIQVRPVSHKDGVIYGRQI